MREGLWQEHLNSIRSVYKTQFEFALRMAKKCLPKDIDYLKPQGGLSLWLNLPDRLNASEIIEKARNEGGNNLRWCTIFLCAMPLINRYV